MKLTPPSSKGSESVGVGIEGVGEEGREGVELAVLDGPNITLVSGGQVVGRLCHLFQALVQTVQMPPATLRQLRGLVPGALLRLGNVHDVAAVGALGVVALVAVRLQSRVVLLRDVRVRVAHVAHRVGGHHRGGGGAAHMALHAARSTCAWAAAGLSLAFAGIAIRSGVGTGVGLLLRVLLIVLLVGGPEQVLFERVQHVVQIEQLGRAEEILHILRVRRPPLSVGTGALCQLVGG